jgi:hypothetical protein
MLEKTKADKADLDALCTEIHGPREERVRTLENRTSNYMITMGLLMTGIATIVTVLFLHIFK